MVRIIQISKNQKPMEKPESLITKISSERDQIARVWWHQWKSADLYRWIFQFFFQIFYALTCLFLNLKYIGVFFPLVPLISILAPKIIEEWIINFKNSDFCKILRLPSPILKVWYFPLGMLILFLMQKILLILYPWSWNSINGNAKPDSSMLHVTMTSVVNNWRMQNS